MNAKVGMTLGEVAGIAIVAGLLYLALAPVEDMPADKGGCRERTEKAERPEKARKLAKEVKPSVPAKATAEVKRERNPPKMTMPKDWYEDLPSAKDRALGKSIQDAQDEGNWTNVLFVAEGALESKSIEVREAAVAALSLQGEVAIPLLLKFVNDKNEDVGESAYRAWDDAVDTVDGDAKKATAIRDALTVLKSEDQMRTAIDKMTMFDRGNALRELAKIAKRSGPEGEIARESYREVAGEEFSTEAAAGVKAILIEHADELP